MSDIRRKASASWTGNLKRGEGLISTDSGALADQAYSFGTRFREEEAGSNPEELIAAAHAACYSMAFANTLDKEGYQPLEISTRATCIMEPLEEGGFKITRMALEVQGEVENIDRETFREIADKADQGCPVSNLLRPGLEIEIQAELR